MSFLEKLGRERLFFDGGTGTLLQAQGLKGGELPETWNLRYPERIQAVHKAYLEAGSHVICTNTFGANALNFPDGGEWDLDELVRAAVDNAKKARAEAGRENDAYIALDLGPTGRLLRPMGDLDFEDAVALFARVVRVGAQAGADLVLIETMSDGYEAKAAVLAAKENSDLPVVVTTVYDENGKMLTGGTIASTVALLEGLRVDALGVNCGMGPEQMLPLAEELVKLASVPVVVNPNAGLPRREGDKTVFDVDPERFAAVMERIAKLGVWGLGGCCGTTPDHIRALTAACRNIPVTPPERKRRTVVSSFSQAVEIGPKPVIIGERINPTGKKRFKEALRGHDLEYILNEGFAQEEAGAHILDVNVGLPEIDEPAMLEEAVCALQSVIPLPLQIDTSDTEAMARAMRRYNGKPMINSVSGKAESMAAVFPLVRKYGGVVVGLALDEGGIPETAEGRLAVARKIYNTAAEYGIPSEDIVIDGLTLTVSSEPKAAVVTLETLRRVRDELGGHTILGVSNVSFGLPRRDIINANFFAMALEAGLSCAIINPLAEGMMGAWRSYCALAGLDNQCGGYIGAYSGQTAAPAVPASGTELSLEECVTRGMQEGAAQSARTALDKGAQPLELVNSALIPALDKVGQGFEKKTLFLPQLLMSAEAAKAAFEVVKAAMASEPQEKQGKVVLATVKGDIHDIGKNIVKVLLENYGFEVIDLGKDVAPEKIVAAAAAPDIQLVGLSALMTTTVVSMEETIKALRESGSGVKVVVGGAVLTQEYADSIDADCYARDAMATVRYAKEVYGTEEKP
ncbi:putative 5-methyltetrahydrofolate--homocysteine methyltransferase [Pseudoflavonifractor capillosus ATCC 29799]|uniref:Methionine synthase n=1 Tax=Pseudoflavonifractor capillosus ATCC 29799 TaxID=411467 RepID=A6NZH5_9FIRM|nr:homocysteine S-methyltransferase family protein [Pseudoflavonifractor capillosus]EDM98824.1 putative 5-methyltetrahydrofolate--homocysteine methyltransferase [Pseudoflavonifractor capillosus ATCC 29799]